MAEVRRSGIKKGWGIFTIILVIIIFILGVIALRGNIIGPDGIFHP